MRTTSKPGFRWRFPIALVVIGGLATLAFPGSVTAAWEQLMRVIGLQGEPLPASPPVLSQHVLDEIDTLEPQVQAQRLLMSAINHYEGAAEAIIERVETWTGKIEMEGALEGTYKTALNANDLRVRAAAIEIDLATGNVSKQATEVERLIRTAETQPEWRTWSLWKLGLLANRDVEREQVFDYLSSYLQDADEETRYWAVEGLAHIGTDETIPLLLEVLHNDASPRIRERGACGLAQSGMLREEQRLSAVPVLIEFADDPTLDDQTQGWVFQALRDITAESHEPDADLWRDWWLDSDDADRFRGDFDLVLIPPADWTPDQAVLDAPVPLSPENGVVYRHHPRDTKVTWRAVPGAAHYIVEVDCFHCCQRNAWCSDVRSVWSYETGIAATEHEFRFAGDNTGRWRVRAVGEDGRMGQLSEWSNFVYSNTNPGRPD